MFDSCHANQTKKKKELRLVYNKCYRPKHLNLKAHFTPGYLVCMVATTTTFRASVVAFTEWQSNTIVKIHSHLYADYRIFDTHLYSSPLSSKSLHRCRRMNFTCCCDIGIGCVVWLHTYHLWTFPIHCFSTTHLRTRTRSNNIVFVGLLQCSTGRLTLAVMHVFCPRIIWIKLLSGNEMHLQWSRVLRVVMQGRTLRLK